MPPEDYPANPAHVLSELGIRVRTLARHQMVQRQVGPEARWVPLDPYLLSLADRCAEWGWGEGPREDPGALAEEARAVLDAENPPSQPLRAETGET